MQRVPTILSVKKEKSVGATWIPRVLVALLFCVAMLSRPAVAQTGQQFVGHIEDTSHASIAGATVTVHNEGTGEDVISKATGAGDYTVPYLKLGTYTINVEAPGFKSISKTHISLQTDQSSKIDFTLPVGNVTETVTVNTDGSQIELSKADRGNIIDAERIQEMPTDGRNVLELVELSPGAVNTHGLTFTRPEDDVGKDTHVNGISGQSVQENLDGSTNDNPSGFAVGFLPPPDSVAEFKLVLNPYDSSYGRSGGGAVDISLKSGTNKIHGDIYDYWRRPWLDANNYPNDYNESSPLNAGNPLYFTPQHKRDQFGLEADGPVVIPHIYDGRDKTFFTLQWEQAYENLPNGTSTISIPDPNWVTPDANGNINFGAQGAVGCPTPGTPGCDPGAQYYNSTTKTVLPLIIYDPLQYAVLPGNKLSTTQHLPFGYGQGNYGGGGGSNVIPLHCTPTPPNTQCTSLSSLGVAIAQYYRGTTPNNTPGLTSSPWTSNFVNPDIEYDISRLGLVKLEHNFGPRDRGSLRWGGYERYETENSNGISVSNPSNAANRRIQPKDETFAIDEVHTFSPNLILDNKINVDNLKTGALSGVFGNFANSLGFSSNYQSELAGIPALFPNIQKTGYVDLGVSNPGNYTINHVLGYLPSVTLIRGRHTFRAGFDMRLYQVASPNTGSNPTFQFNNQYTQQFYFNNKQGGDAAGYSSGNGIASLLIGDASGGSLSYKVSPFYSQHYYAGWAQDDWKVTPKLTLNFGVRYDILQAPTERHNKLNYAFDFNDVNTQINSQVQASHANTNCSVTPSTGPGTCLNGPIMGGIRFAGTTTDQTAITTTNPRGAYATNLLHIQPRFGLAYAFSPRTSLRAGFGEMFINNNSNDSSNGFSADSSLLTSTAPCAGCNFQPTGSLLDPYPTGTVQPLGSIRGLATTPGASVNFSKPNYQVPNIWEYSVSLEQLMSRHDVLDISYSGSRLYNGESSLNLNPKSAAYNAQCDFDRNGDPLSHNLCDGTGTGQGLTANPFQGNTFFNGADFTNATISRGDLSRPYPAFTDITQDRSNTIHTWYNSLQASFSHRVSHALTLQANYTWSKAMSSGKQIDASNGLYDRVLDGNDRPNLISFSSVFYLPVGRGQTFLGHTSRLVDAAVGGWEISPLYVFQEGTPWSLGGTNWIINGPIVIKAHDIQPTSSQPYKRLQGVTPCVAYENNQVPLGAPSGTPSQTTLVYGPTYFEFGCTSPALIRTAPTYSVAHNIVFPGVRHGNSHEFAVSLSKRFAWNERANLQLRLDAFNVLNHPNWTGDYKTDPTSSYWGSIRKGPDGPAGPPRDLQLSGKLTF